MNDAHALFKKRFIMVEDYVKSNTRNLREIPLINKRIDELRNMKATKEEFTTLSEYLEKNFISNHQNEV